MSVWSVIAHPETLFGGSPVGQAPASSAPASESKPVLTRIGETIGDFAGSTTASAIKPVFTYLLIIVAVAVVAYVATKKVL